MELLFLVGRGSVFSPCRDYLCHYRIIFIAFVPFPFPSPDCHYRDYYLRSGPKLPIEATLAAWRVFFAKGKSRRNRKEEKIRPCIPSISAYGYSISPYTPSTFLHRFSILAVGGSRERDFLYMSRRGISFNRRTQISLTPLVNLPMEFINAR